MKTKKLTFTKSTGQGDGTTIKATAEFNQHGSQRPYFSITGEIASRTGRFESGGCIHEEIEKHFPELRPFIKWHLCNTEAPMYYIENTMYHAKKVEANTVQKRCAKGLPMWHSTGDTPRKLPSVTSCEECPETYEPAFEDEKIPNYDFARNTAIWPEATDEELSAPDLKQRLEARLPDLMKAFYQDMERLGLSPDAE